MKELQELAQLHRALSSVTRLRILRMLIERPMCVNAITERLNISQPSVSQHLGILERAGLVSGQRDGCKVHYRLVQENLESVRITLAELPYGSTGDFSDTDEDQ